MTREEIIHMAREAWGESGNGWVTDAWFSDRAEAFEAFATLVEARAAAAEREACAKVCDKASNSPNEWAYERAMATRLANAIRARGAA